MGAKWWTAPVMWAGETVFVVGGGPSLLGMDLHPIHERRVIGVNNAFVLGQWVDITFFGDCRWYEMNRKLLADYGGLIVTCCKKENWPDPRVKMMSRFTRKRAGLYLNHRNAVVWNNNSGAAAINLACHLGAKRIVLLGFDMKIDNTKPEGTNGGNNWHDHHKEKWTPKAAHYKTRFLPQFPAIARDAQAAGIEILNATPGSALECFPMVKLEDML